MFAAGVARSLELDEETADVLRLTLTEICSEAIERRTDGRIAIDVSADTFPIRIIVVVTGVQGDVARGGSTELPYRRMLIDALAPDVTFVEERRSHDRHVHRIAESDRRRSIGFKEVSGLMCNSPTSGVCTSSYHAPR